MSPYLKTDTEWYVTVTGEIYKPILFQLEMETEVLTPPTFFNAQWSDQDTFRIGTRAFYNVATGLPEYAVGSTGV